MRLSLFVLFNCVVVSTEALFRRPRLLSASKAIRGGATQRRSQTKEVTPTLTAPKTATRERGMSTEVCAYACTGAAIVGAALVVFQVMAAGEFLQYCSALGILVAALGFIAIGQGIKTVGDGIKDVSDSIKAIGDGLRDHGDGIRAAGEAIGEGIRATGRVCICMRKW